MCKGFLFLFLFFVCLGRNQWIWYVSQSTKMFVFIELKKNIYKTMLFVYLNPRLQKNIYLFDPKNDISILYFATWHSLFFVIESFILYIFLYKFAIISCYYFVKLCTLLHVYVKKRKILFSQNHYAT